LENALQTIRDGKPAVMIHCAVHAFRRAKEVHEWENGVGMRSKVHDKFGPFQTVKLDPQSPILDGFPDDWKTSGDELYQTIEFLKNSHPLLSAKSPRDGRVHIVCWTQTYGKGRVFATTLGHDMTTAQDPAYLNLLARGLLWSCDKLDQK
jgi:type 1 glutamine amidotransferase